MLYKDTDGKIYACSAVCPHMKGSLRWNQFEKSWNCLVHGSRFDTYGKTINGLAKSNLRGEVRGNHQWWEKVCYSIRGSYLYHYFDKPYKV